MATTRSLSSSTTSSNPTATSATDIEAAPAPAPGHVPIEAHDHLMLVNFQIWLRWLRASPHWQRIPEHLLPPEYLITGNEEEEEEENEEEGEESAVSAEEAGITSNIHLPSYTSVPFTRRTSSCSTTSSGSTAPSMTDFEQPFRISIAERGRQVRASLPPIPHDLVDLMRFYLLDSLVDSPSSSTTFLISTIPSVPGTRQPQRFRIEGGQDQSVYRDVHLSRQSFRDWFNRSAFATHEEWPPRVIEEFLSFTAGLNDVGDEEDESAVNTEEEESGEEVEGISSTSTTTAPPMPDTEQASPPSVAERAQLILAELPDFPTIGGAMVARIYLLGLVRRLHQPDQEWLHHRHMNRMFPSHPQVEVGPASGSSRDVLHEGADSAVNSGEDESNESGDEEMGRARTRRRASAEEGEGEAEEEELDTRAASSSSPPTVPSMTAPSTTIIGGLRRIPLVEALTRDAAMMYHFPRYSAALSMWRTRRAMREGNEPLRTVLSAPVAVSWKRMAEEELTQIGAKKSKKNDEEEVESDEEDVISSAEDETSDAEVEKQVTSSARERRRPFAQMKELLLRYRAVMTPLPPSPPPSIPSSPTMSPTSFTTSSTFSTTAPAKPPLDEVVLRHILTNIDTFHKHPAEEMIRTAIDSLMERGEYRLVHALLDDAMRAGRRPIDDVWSEEEEEERESVGEEESSVSEDGDAENDKEAADEVPDNVCLPAEENANTRKTRLAAVGALPSGWNASLLIRPRFFAGKAPDGNRNGNAINGVGRRRMGIWVSG